MLDKADERALISRAQMGDRDTLEQLLTAHCADLEQHIERRLSMSAAGTLTVDDVIQETFVQAFRDIDRFQSRPGGSLLGWLKAIAEHRRTDVHFAQEVRRDAADGELLCTGRIRAARP